MPDLRVGVIDRVLGPPAGAIIIDSTWLGLRTPPYELDTLNGYYWLDVDVSTPRTAFYASNDGITFDMNVHKVTFNTSGLDVQLANEDFTTDLSDWSFSGPGANWRRRTDVSYTTRDCWTGTTCLEIDVPASTTYTLETVANYTLTSGLAYGVTAWQSTPDGGLVINLSLDTLLENDWDVDGGDNRRGQFAHVYWHPNSNQTGKLSMTIQNTDPSSTRQFRLDRIMISSHSYCGFGRPSGTEWYTRDLHNLTSGDNLTIKGVPGIAEIIEGAPSYDGQPIFMRNQNGLIVDGVKLTTHEDSVHDVHGRCIHTQAVSNGPVIIRNCIFNDQAKAITNRDNQYGYACVASVMEDDTVIEACDCTNAPQGIVRASIESSVKANATIDIIGITGGFKCRYTNGFAVKVDQQSASTGTHTVRDLNIDTTVNDFNGRGIHINDCDGTGLINIYNNLVKVRELQRIQARTNLVHQNGSYGIEYENENKNVRAWNNTFIVESDWGGAPFQCSPDATHVIDIEIDGDTYIFDALSDPDDENLPMAIFYLERAPANGTLSLKNLFCQTNVDICSTSNGGGLVEILDSTLRYVDDGFPGNAWDKFWQGQGTLRWINTTFYDAGSKTHALKTGDSLNDSNEVEIQFQEKCVFTFDDGGPLLGISVTIRAANDTILWTGSPTSSGQVLPQLQWWNLIMPAGLTAHTATNNNNIKIQTDYGGGSGTEDIVNLDSTTRIQTFSPPTPV